jgi:endonuclease I
MLRPRTRLPRRFDRFFPITFISALLLPARWVLAAYEVPDPAWAPPTHYYDAATGTGNALQVNLHNIISSNFTGRTYGDFRTASALLDQDPNNPNNVLLIYTRASVAATWDGGITWNREHQWCVSWLGTGDPGNNDTPSIETDEFELRPVKPSVNTSRSNNFYGLPNTTGSDGVPAGNSNAWYPGDADAGEVARTFFYLATRYYTGSPTLSLTNVQLINTSTIPGSGSYQGGDLASFLKWNYEFGVDNFERRRNQYIYGSAGDLTDHALNPTYYQGNRNPFIDHPEYVWSIFGTDKDLGGNVINNSQLSVAAPDANGASAATVDLGRIMKNGSFGTSNVTFTKTGSDPTTFDITAAGSAMTMTGAGHLVIGTGQSIDYNNQTRTITTGLNASTSTSGLKSGAVTIHNSDLTSSGAGHGSADGNDTINVSGAVLDQRVITPSVTSVDFGTVVVGATVGSSLNLSTSGDDNNRTRVNVAGSSAIDANSMQITGSTALFNSATSTSSRNIGGALSSAGNKSGSLSLSVTTAENGGAGLAGEGSYPAISVGYTATVLDHAIASFTTPTDNNSLLINFGSLVQGTTAIPIAFSVNNLVTTAGFTAGLDLLNVVGGGNTGVLSTNLAPFANLAAGGARSFQASFDTINTGSFSATYTLNLSDDSTLLGAAAQQLTLNVSGVVVPEFMPGDLDRDHQVTAGDIQTMLDALTDLETYQTLKGLTQPQLNVVADVNVDGNIDNLDAQALLVSLANASGGSGGISAVPEPSAIALFALGAAILLVRRSRA